MKKIIFSVVTGLVVMLYSCTKDESIPVSDITLSVGASAEVMLGQSLTVSISGGSGTYQVNSLSKENVEVTLVGKTQFELKAKKVGNAIIEVVSATKKARLAVKVVDKPNQPGIYDLKGVVLFPIKSRATNATSVFFMEDYAPKQGKVVSFNLIADTQQSQQQLVVKSRDITLEELSGETLSASIFDQTETLVYLKTNHYIIVLPKK